MIDECFSEGLSIIIGVFAEIEHNRHPNIIGSNLQISMIHISFVKSSKKSIRILFAQRAAFIIEVKLLCILIFPRFPVCWFYNLSFFLQFLYGDSLKPLENTPRIILFISTQILLFLQMKLIENIINKSRGWLLTLLFEHVYLLLAWLI